MRDCFSAIPRLAWRDQHRVGARPARHLDRCGSVAHVPVASRTEALLGHLLVVDRAASCHLRIALRRPSSQRTCSPFTATLSIVAPACWACSHRCGAGTGGTSSRDFCWSTSMATSAESSLSAACGQPAPVDHREGQWRTLWYPGYPL